MAFRDDRGRTLLAEVPNRRPEPLVEPLTVDPEPFGVDNEPETTQYAQLTFTVGSEQVTQEPGPGPTVATLRSAQRSGLQYAARAVLGAEREGDGVRLVVSTSDPSGRRLVVRVRPLGRRAVRVSAAPTPADGVAVVADSFATGRDEAFRGFGGRHNALDQRGQLLESFVNQSNFSVGPLARPPAGLPGTRSDRYLFPNGPTGPTSCSPRSSPRAPTASCPCATSSPVGAWPPTAPTRGRWPPRRVGWTTSSRRADRGGRYAP